MSFLPYSGRDTGAWAGSLGLSAIAHGGLVALLLGSSIPFLPEGPNDTNALEGEVFVSLEILDAGIIDTLEPTQIDGTEITEDGAEDIPEDVIDELIPDDTADLLEADETEEAALGPLEAPEVEAVEDTIEAVELDALEEAAEMITDEIAFVEETPEEPLDLTEPEAPPVEETEPEEIETTELDALTTDAPPLEEDELFVQPEEPVLEELTATIIEDEPEFAAETVEIAPETVEVDPVEEPVAPRTPVLEPEVVDLPEITEPEAVVEAPTNAPLMDDTADAGVDIQNVNPIEDDIVSPLGEGGFSTVPADVVTVPTLEIGEEDVIVLLAPEAPQLPDSVSPPAVETALPTPSEDSLEPAIVEDAGLAPEGTTPDEGQDTAAQAPDESINEPTDPVEATEALTSVDGDTPEEATVVEPAAPEPGAEGTAEEPMTPATTIRRVVEAPSAQAVGLGQLLRQIRATPNPQCTLLLPRLRGETGLSVSLIGPDDAALGAFADQITERVAIDVSRSFEVIDGRQCAALDAVRQASSYPASRLGIALEATSLSSGDTLRARVLGAGGLYLTLLVIDDNGVVQDLNRFTKIEDNVPVIDAPVARSGPTRATRQILLVMGSPSGPIDVRDQIGQVAQDVFALINAQTLEDMVFGLATFDVR
ncbi:MAG: hypothetical protein MK098_09940 [Marinovum sp.]|nr:hypothetical protein [Marinovum sp.]